MLRTDTGYKQIDEHLGDIFGKDLFKTRNLNCCPHCESNKVIRHGKYKNGQRYLCKICGRTFCERTYSPWYYSKKNPSIWIKFIELMVQQNTLKECSRKLRMDISTAFYWRHKILHALVDFKEPNKLQNLIQMTKVVIKENFKGNRKAPEGRREKVWTIVAADSNEKILARPICKSRWNQINFNKIIYWRIDKQSYLSTYGDRFIWDIEKKHNIGKNIIKSGEKDILRGYVKEFQSSIKRYYGVATKYLTHYLYWISISFESKDYNSISLIYKLIERKVYIKSRNIKGIEAIGESA